MIITFLGTGHGYAEKERACSATLIETDGINKSAYLIDAGIEIDYYLKRLDKDVCCIKDIFLTHMHEDHAGGLTSAYKSYLRYGKTDDINIYFPEKSGIEGFKTWMSALHMTAVPENYQGFKPVTPGRFFSDENITVTAIPTQHMASELKSFAYMIESEGKRVGFTGDLSASGDFHDFPHCFWENEFDLIVCEMSHFKTEAAIEKIRHCKTTHLIFNHIRSAEKIEEVSQYFDRLPFPARAAFDGMTINI